MHTTTTRVSHNTPALPCSRSGRTTATGQCSRAVLRSEAATCHPDLAHLRHTYTLSVLSIEGRRAQPPTG